MAQAQDSTHPAISWTDTSTGMLMLARAASTVPFPSLLAAAERELLWTVLGLVLLSSDTV